MFSELRCPGSRSRCGGETQHVHVARLRPQQLWSAEEVRSVALRLRLLRNCPSWDRTRSWFGVRDVRVGRSLLDPMSVLYRGEWSLPDAVAGDDGEMALERHVLAIEQRDDALDCIGERRRHISDDDDSRRDAQAPFEYQLSHVEVEGQQDSRLGAGRCENRFVRSATRVLEDGVDVVTRGAKGFNGGLRNVLVGEEPTHPVARRAA